MAAPSAAAPDRHPASATSTAARPTPASPTRSPLLIGDGRIALGTRLPSERELDRRPRRLADHRHPGLRRAARRRATPRPAAGPGTFTRVPGGRARAHDRALLPRARRRRAPSTSTAPPPSAPPGLAAAYAEAAARAAGLPRRPRLLPRRAARAAGRDRRDVRRPRAAHRPGPGHGHRRARCRAASIVAQAFTGPGTGRWWSRRSTPTPPRRSGTPAPGWSGSPVDPDGWDLDAVGADAAPGCARGWPT